MSLTRRLKLILFFVFILFVWWAYWNMEADRRLARSVEKSIEEGRRMSALILAPNAEEAIGAAVLISYEPPSGTAVLFLVPPTLCLDAALEDPQRVPTSATTLEAAYAKESLDRVSGRLRKLFGRELAFVTILPTAHFFRMIDLMGGIFVDVPVRISFRSADDSPNDRVAEWIEIPEGDDVFLDSDKAEMYLAYRYDGLGVKGQLFRGRRLAIAFFQRMKTHLKRAWFREELVGSFTGSGAESLVPLCAALADIPAESLDVRPLPGKSDMNAGVFWLSRAGLAGALPKELKPLIQAGAPKSRITVQLLNGSGVPGAAGILREKLDNFSDIDVVEMGNAESFNYDKTHVIDRGGHLPSADRIREVLGTGVLRQDINPKAMVDVTVIIGKDAL